MIVKVCWTRSSNSLCASHHWSWIMIKTNSTYVIKCQKNIYNYRTFQSHKPFSWLLVQKLLSLARLATTLGGNSFLPLLYFILLLNTLTLFYPAMFSPTTISIKYSMQLYVTSINFLIGLLHEDLMIGLFPLISYSFGSQQLFEPLFHNLDRLNKHRILCHSLISQIVNI